MKYFNILFVFGISLIISSCDSQHNSKSESGVSSKSYSFPDYSFDYSQNTPTYPSFSYPSFSSETSNPVIVENQPLFNRMMNDYYEQRICNTKTLSSNMYSKAIPNEMDNRKVDDLTISYCFKPNSKGAYIVGIDKKFNMTWDGEAYFYSFNGVTIGYFYDLPDVWYKGNILYLTDAYYIGLLDDNDISTCLNVVNYMVPNTQSDSLLFNGNSQAHYADTIEPFAVQQEIIYDNNTYFEVREDLFNKLIEDNATFSSYKIELSDIHVFQSFAKVNDAICVEFSIDGITPPKHLCNAFKKEWNNDLVIGDIIVERFQDDMPIVWKNRTFYPIDEAFQNSIISKETTLELLRQYNLSTQKGIGDLIPLI